MGGFLTYLGANDGTYALSYKTSSKSILYFIYHRNSFCLYLKYSLYTIYYKQYRRYKYRMDNIT